MVDTPAVAHGKSAQYQFVITVEGWDGKWVSRTGGDNQANIQAVYDGGSLVPDLVAGRPRPTNITVTRVYDVDRDGPIHHDYVGRVGRWVTNITVQPTDADLSPVGDARTYTNVKLARLGEPPADAQSDDPSRWEAEFAVSQIA